MTTGFTGIKRLPPRYFLLLFFCLLCHCIIHTDPKVSIKIDSLSERTKVFETLNVRVTVIASQEGLILVDTQRSPGIMSELLNEIRKAYGRDDILYVINTHGHWDHASGNQLFPDSIIIGHSNCPEYMRQNPANSKLNMLSVRDHLLELQQELDTLEENSETYFALQDEISGRQIIRHDLESIYKPTPPGKTFRDSLILNLSDLILKLYYAGNAHTDNDIIIYIPEERIVITGDLFTTRSYYGFRVNQMVEVERLISVIDKILHRGQGVDYLITSHTEILKGEDLEFIRTSLREKYRPFMDKNSAARLLLELLNNHMPDIAEREYRKRISVSGIEYYYSEDEFAELGRRFMGTGKHAAALTAFRTACDAFPESALAYDNLGEIYLKMGHIEKAIQNYERSLYIMPYNKNAEKMLKVIRENNF